MLKIRAAAAMSIPFMTIGGCRSHVTATAATATTWHTDNQLAAGEWKVEVQTPPCGSYKNIQVIYPKESGAPITIECDLMPVGEQK